MGENRLLEKEETGVGFPPIEDLGEGFGNLRCSWTDSVCNETVEYRIEHIPSIDQQKEGEPGEIEFFCPRHYVLELARMLEIHGDSCGHPPMSHLKSYGPIDDPIFVNKILK